MQANRANGRRWQTAWRSAVLASGLVLAGPYLLSAAYGQSQPPWAQALDAADHTPWPVLDDGRVVLTVFNVKIAMPTCARCLEYQFRSADPRSGVSDRYAPTVRDVIAHPERLRYIAAKSDRLRLELANDWRPEVNRGPFLGRVDPMSLPSTAYMYLILYKQSRTEPCWTGPQPDRECLSVHHMDVTARRDDQIIAGMSVLRGPYGYEPPGFIGGFVLPVEYSFYLAPTDHPRDAIGLPIRFDCNPLRTCKNSAFHTGRGFALRRDADLFFTFQEGDHAYDFAPGQWIGLHDRTTDAVRTLFLD